MKRIYLDYAATTPVEPSVLRAMAPYFETIFGNPGSLHSFGQEAIAAVDRSRETIAKSIGGEFRDIIFTSSATEANNLALRGAVRRFHESQPRVIISAIEHESVLETAQALQRDGVDLVYIPVNRHGLIDMKKMKESLNERTVLVSVMYANNEIGTIQPISEIAKIIHQYKAEHKVAKKQNIYPLFHTDAAQAFQFLNCDVAALGVDMMTLSSHKIYGPKGAAALYVKQLGALHPLLSGGGQEFGLRSGTENVPAIVGFAKAVELADAARKKESKRIAALRANFLRGIAKMFPQAEVNGITTVDGMSTLPNMLNMYFPGHAAQDVLTRLDLAGVAASSGSACHSRAFESSYVIGALGFDSARAKSSIRFSFGRPTTKADLAVALKAMHLFSGQ